MKNWGLSFVAAMMASMDAQQMRDSWSRAVPLMDNEDRAHKLLKYSPSITQTIEEALRPKEQIRGLCPYYGLYLSEYLIDAIESVELIKPKDGKILLIGTPKG